MADAFLYQVYGLEIAPVFSAISLDKVSLHNVLELYSNASKHNSDTMRDAVKTVRWTTTFWPGNRPPVRGHWMVRIANNDRAKSTEKRYVSNLVRAFPSRRSMIW